MFYINGLIGCGLAFLALLHLGVPGCSLLLIWMYGAASGLAFLSLVPGINQVSARLLAFAATLCLFFFFAGFFQATTMLSEDWYAVHLPIFGQLLSAFAMIPVLAEYSCLAKADDGGKRAGGKAGRFFSVS